MPKFRVYFALPGTIDFLASNEAEAALLFEQAKGDGELLYEGELKTARFEHIKEIDD